MTTISTKTPTARKEHICDYCSGKIEIGTMYESQFNTYDGDVYTWKNHISCNEIASKLKMQDGCDEGVTGDVFYECINNEFHEIIDENNKDIIKFSDKLDYVKAYHKIDYNKR